MRFYAKGSLYPNTLKSCINITLIGQGSFGTVYKAYVPETGESIAVKHIQHENIHRRRQSIDREIFSLQIVKHQNIVKLLEVMSDESATLIVLEYVESNMRVFIANVCRPLNERILQYYMHQLFSGLAYLHEIHIMHRDLKPDNILISKSGIIKITDFGQSCTFASNSTDAVYENEVGCAWYRAPELLFGSCKYSLKIDTWACGCILAETLNGKPLFQGNNDFQQVALLMKILGTPSEEVWKDFNLLPDSAKVIYENIPARTDWSLVVPSASDHCVQLIRQLIVYDPNARFSATEALMSQFFKFEASMQVPYVPSASNEVIE